MPEVAPVMSTHCEGPRTSQRAGRGVSDERTAGGAPTTAQVTQTVGRCSRSLCMEHQRNGGRRARAPSSRNTQQPPAHRHACAVWNVALVAEPAGAASLFITCRVASPSRCDDVVDPRHRRRPVTRPFRSRYGVTAHASERFQSRLCRFSAPLRDGARWVRCRCAKATHLRLQLPRRAAGASAADAANQEDHGHDHIDKRLNQQLGHAEHDRGPQQRQHKGGATSGCELPIGGAQHLLDGLHGGNREV